MRIPVRRRHSTRFHVIATLVALVAVVNLAWRALLDSHYFALRDIRIVGVSPRLAEELDAAVRQHLPPNPTTLSLDLQKISSSLAAHPSLRQVSLEIAYPHALLIRASERVPAAILSADGFYLVARDGVAMQRLRPAELRHYELPFITGISPEKIEIGEKVPSAGLSRALEMIELVRERNQDLYSRFSEVSISQDPVSQLDLVTARLRGGMEVRFGNTNPVEKLPLLDFFIQQQRQAGNDPFAMAYVDLRVPNQIVYLDKLTAEALRAGAVENALGSMGPELKQGEDAREDKSKGPAKGNDTSKSTAGAAQESARKQRETKKAAAMPEISGSVERESLQSSPSFQRDHVELDAEESPGRRSLRERLGIPFLRRSRAVSPNPVLRAPVDSGD